MNCELLKIHLSTTPGQHAPPLEPIPAFVVEGCRIQISVAVSREEALIISRGQASQH